MKKYEVPLKIVRETKSKKGLALAKVLMDCMSEEELYETVSEKENLGTFSEKEGRDYLELLEIPVERVAYLRKNKKINNLKNYDVALACALAERVEEAQRCMEYLKRIGAKEPLNTSDFVGYEVSFDFSEFIGEGSFNLSEYAEDRDFLNLMKNSIKKVWEEISAYKLVLLVFLKRPSLFNNSDFKLQMNFTESI